MLLGYSALAQQTKLEELYINGLKQAKYYMVNGELRKAQLTLDRLQLYQSTLSPVHMRYSAIVSFLLENFHKSRQLLEGIYGLGKKNRLYWIPKTCELHLLSLFITDASPYEINRSWQTCLLTSDSVKKTPSSWIRVLVDLHSQREITELNNPLKSLTDEELFSVLKLSLYLDESDRLVDQLSILQSEDLADPLLREMVGEVYYRNHRLVESLEALRGLETPNALVIRSDISSLQKKYEVSYATLKQAHGIKNYSAAVLKRIIPLSIILDQTSELEKYLDQYSLLFGITTQIESLAAYAYYAQGNPQSSVKLLNNVELARNLSFEEIALKAFSAYKAKSDRAYEAGYNLCQKKSSYCWLPVLDAYQLKRKKTKLVDAKLPFDRFYNLSDEGSLADQEEIFIDVELLDEKQQFLDYLARRK